MVARINNKETYEVCLGSAIFMPEFTKSPTGVRIVDKVPTIRLVKGPAYNYKGELIISEEATINSENVFDFLMAI